MAVSRRRFLQTSGGSIVYLLSAGATSSLALSRSDRLARKQKLREVHALQPFGTKVVGTEWIRFDTEGQITVYTGRNELGQGLRTVIYNFLCQAFELPEQRLTLVMGDTRLCPDDGPTTGSAATRHLGWSFWHAAFQIRQDLIALAAEKLEYPAADLRYSHGYVVHPSHPEIRLSLADMAQDYSPVQNTTIDVEVELPPYIDMGTLNVDADDIVTGSRKFAGDFHREGTRYAAIVVPEYHAHLTKPLSIDTSGWGEEAADYDVYQNRYRKRTQVIVVADSYPALQRAQSKLKVQWQVPEQPEQLVAGDALRDHATLSSVISDVGSPEQALESAEHRITESYYTQHMSQVPLETDTALAYQDGEDIVLRIGSQAPFRVQHSAAFALDIDPERVHVISAPAGGAFGSKAGNSVGSETVQMAVKAGVPIKHVYSRKSDIQHQGRYKEAVAIDLSSGVDAQGQLVARTMDVFQDRGSGTERLYALENTRTRLYDCEVQVKHAVMRGTSFTQNIFALECHTESVARQVGMDVLEFRRRNILHPEFIPLIDRCEALLDRSPGTDDALAGVGYGIIHHGTMQLGIVGARVAVDPDTGMVAIKQLVGVFDIGVVINRNTATMGIKGAMIWGLGAALLEQVDLDGHRCHTQGFGDYQIPRMRDVPEITVEYVNPFRPGRPHGCGEMPLPPTIAAIANAVSAAIDGRIYSLPITPEKVLAAMGTAKPDVG